MNNTSTLWEENALIEPKKNLTNKLILEPNDIINEIKSDFVKNECENIGSKKKWKRNYVGEKFGGLTVIKQYSVKNKNGTIIMVDYKCNCGSITINKRIGCVKRQKMCLICKKKNQFKILPNGETSFNLLYASYVKSAKKRLLDFQLDKEDFRKLTKQNCFYCGTVPNTTIRPKSVSGGYVYNGIDRKDNNKGYFLENCVSCCKVCNYFKLKLSVEDFLNHIKKIYEYRELNTL